jgi:hypothetical protein
MGFGAKAWLSDGQETLKCGSTERAETKRELKAQRKNPAEAGQMSRACAAARHDNCQATSTTLLNNDG